MKTIYTFNESVFNEFCESFKNSDFIEYIGFVSFGDSYNIILFVKNTGKLPNIPKNYSGFPVDVYRIERKSRTKKRKRRKNIKIKPVSRTEILSDEVVT